MSGVAEIWQLAVLYAIAGGATAFFMPASNAIVPQILPGTLGGRRDARRRVGCWRCAATAD